MRDNLKPGIHHDNWLDQSQSRLVNVEVRPYSLKELCRLYRLTYKTMHTCIAHFVQQLGPKKGRFYNVKQVEIIFIHMGIPYSIHEK
jgi:hypothetical protein